MMDFLDPKKSRAHEIRLMVGYVLLGIAVILATLILKYQADGYSVKNGEVIQNGLVFVSSTPSSADIIVNGQRKDTTNSRLTLVSGTYTLKLTRSGYRNWQRGLTVEGSSVEHVDYPLLIPQTLVPKDIASYAVAPQLATQSPDRRWLLIQRPASPLDFDEYDIKDPKKAVATKTSVSIPQSVVTNPTGANQMYEVVEWSNDNEHFVLKHSFDGKVEYLLISRKSPDQSLNLTQKLALQPEDVPALQDKKFDHYFVLNGPAQTLKTASLSKSGQTDMLTGVIAYKSYGSDVVLYVTKQKADAGKVNVEVYQNARSYTIRSLAEAPSYALGLSRYQNAWYVTAGDGPENKVYIYKDPVASLQNDTSQPLVPADVLKIAGPSYAAISANSQFVMAESGNDFVVYDVENDRTHTYHIDAPLDAPQLHATWMDGNRLTMVSNGNAIIFDYDGTNQQTLTASSPQQTPFFDAGYSSMYGLSVTKAANGAAPPPAGQFSLTATWLRTAQDQ